MRDLAAPRRPYIRSAPLRGRSSRSGLMAAVLMLACAPAGLALAQPTEPAPTVSGASESDPFEGFNRKSFALGMGIDRLVLGPVARGYLKITPAPVRRGVSNMVYNLGEPSTVLNLALQGRPKRTVRATSRFLINSTVGGLGLFDVATKMGIKRREADFGQTFGRYGAKAGAYVYVPVMGPLNMRDGSGRVLDMITDPVSIVGGGLETRFGRAKLGMTLLDFRSTAEPAFSALKDATDPYATLRSAYGQRREAFVRQATGEVEDLPDFGDPTPAPSPPPEAPSPGEAGL